MSGAGHESAANGVNEPADVGDASVATTSEPVTEPADFGAESVESVDTTPEPVAELPEAVRRWQGQLLDLSMRNPLINLGDTGVPLFVDEGTLAAVENVVAQGVPVTVRGAEDLDEVEVHESARGVHDLDAETLLSALNDGGLVFAQFDTRQLRTALSDLRRRAQLAREELGASALYLTLGALRITSDSGAEALAPLLLLPVTLTGPRLGPHVIQLEPGAAVRPNECLLEWLRRTNKFEPEVLREPPLLDPGVDVPRLIEGLRKALHEAGLEFEVVPESRIALLKFSTMQMWRDVHDHWQEFTDNALVQHLVRADGTDFTDPVGEPDITDTTEADLALPLPADGSQIKAVAWAAAGRTFVLEGPPGTGKSQTITNLIAHALHQGQKVLFVAEKQAALDVVARRLRQVGLGGVCLDLYGKGQTSRAVRAHLRAASEPVGAESPTDDNGSVRLAERRRDLAERLAAYPSDLREAGPSGVAQLDSAERTAAAREFVAASDEFRDALRSEIAAGVARRAHADEGEQAHAARADHHAHGAVETGAVPETRGDQADAPADDASGRSERTGIEALRDEVRTAHASGLQELIAGHIDAILRVTPCLLMSPTTVAQYLPARPGLFDIVVFDESSQIRVSAAVGAMGRARAAIVVGDAQQMPPSELFTVSGGEDDDADEQESILLEAHRAGLASLRLERHYRSRSEVLVSFSNRHYYDGTLATFPTPPRTFTDTGVELLRVYGSFEQGRGGRKLNIIEANAVIDEVRTILAENPESSVGVMTFNTSQAEYILEKLEADPSESVRAALEREDEPLFVKNLENVQGDERDYIVFSLTYSRDADGRLPSNFGLLARAGGERRLNVAVTRARVRNVLFASFDPPDIADSDASRGPAHLREYMESALNDDLLVARTSEPEADDYREDVAEALRAAGAEVVESLGLSGFRVDIAARHGEGGWVAVQLDSDSWAGRPAVADRDVMPEAVLVGNMGWAALTQVYRHDWITDPEAVVAGIMDLCRGGAPASAESEPEQATRIGSVPVEASTEDPPVVLPPQVAQAVAAQAETVRLLAEAVAAGGSTDQAMRDAVERLQASGHSIHAPEAPGTPGTPEPAEPEPTEPAGPRLTAFVPASDSHVADRSVIHALPDPEAVAQVAAQWREVVAAEGPVQVDRALRVVAQRFGWRHLMPHRRGSVLDALPADIRTTREVWQGETFLWPEDTAPESYREVRGGTRAHRKIAEIAPQERANAIRLVLTESDGRCTENDLVRGVNEIFGFGRLGGMSRGQLRNDLTSLVEADEVDTAGGEVRLTSAAQPTH